jgi:two-component system OmpR family response regulator
MRVAAATRMDVDMNQFGHALVIERAGEADVEPRFLPGLTQRSIPRGFTWVDVATGLQPDAQPLVFEQQHSARTDDDRRAGHVGGIRLLIEWTLQRVESGEELVDRHAFPVVERVAARHIGTKSGKRHPAVVPAHVNLGGNANDIAAIRPWIQFQFRQFLTDTSSQGQTANRADESGSAEPVKERMDNDTILSHRILIAVQDPDLRRISVAGLRAAGFCVSAPTDGDAAVLLAESFSPDVFIVDSYLPSPDGRPLYERLRESSEQYLLCVTDHDHQMRTSVLHSGADDVVSAPIHADELAARCHALLRRPRQIQHRAESVAASTLVLGPLTIDFGRREVRVDDEEVQTTRIEFSLLEQLCRRPTEVCTREDLLDAVWGPKWVGDSHVVDVHLSNLRRKLDKAAPDTKVIHTVRGVGFRLANDVTDALELSGASLAVLA